MFLRGLSIRIGECDVPSQPMLEWLCLKLLGAAQLMSCTLSRCSRAFMYPFCIPCCIRTYLKILYVFANTLLFT